MSRVTPTILFCIALTVVVLTVIGNHGLLHLRKLNNEQAQLDTINREIKSDINAVEKDIHSLQQNPETLERLAREELGLSREGEIVYIFPNSNVDPK